MVHVQQDGGVAAHGGGAGGRSRLAKILRPSVSGGCSQVEFNCITQVSRCKVVHHHRGGHAQGDHKACRGQAEQQCETLALMKAKQERDNQFASLPHA